MKRNSEQYFGVLRFGFPVTVGILSALVSETSPTALGYAEIRSGLVKYISTFTRPKTSCRHRKAPERRSSGNYTENGKTKKEIQRIDNWRDPSASAAHKDFITPTRGPTAVAQVGIASPLSLPPPRHGSPEDEEGVSWQQNTNPETEHVFDRR